ncbi:MAG: transposase [Vallitaleaceae bacterium]|jgi:putative transposase|nr:transposase [Vallitaleaceae bacterium]
MARQARVKDEFGTFHISQNGGEHHMLFATDDDRIKFLEILKRTEMKFMFKLYGYCVSSDDHYDLVIDVNGGDLSKIMQSINIAYAMYVGCDGKLFKDRYKSTQLGTEEEKSSILKTIELRKPANELWRKCYILKDDNNYKLSPLSDSYRRVDIDYKNQSILETYFTGCDLCIGSMEAAKDKLITLARSEEMHVEGYIKEKSRRNELIRTFRKHSTLSLKEIGELFGGLTESSICKILNDCK